MKFVKNTLKQEILKPHKVNRKLGSEFERQVGKTLSASRNPGTGADTTWIFLEGVKFPFF